MGKAGLLLWMIMLGLGLAASSVQAVTRTFTWNASITSTGNPDPLVTGYKMYRSTDNGMTFVAQLPTTAATVLTWTDPNVPTGTICYEVVAINAAGESARSNRVCFSMPGAVPRAPEALSVVEPVAAVKAPATKRQ